MSSIAEFIRLPVSTLEKLRSDYDGIVEQYGESVADYDGSGYVIATLLPYLDKQGIKLTKSSHDALASYLCQARETTLFILTSEHKDAFLARLSPEQFSKDELRDYFNDFNAAQEPDEVGQAMLDGIAALHQSLAALESDSIILLNIG